MGPRPRALCPLAQLRPVGHALQPSSSDRSPGLDRSPGQVRRGHPPRLFPSRPQMALQVHDAGQGKRCLHLARRRPPFAPHALRQLRKIRGGQAQEVSLNWRRPRRRRLPFGPATFWTVFVPENLSNRLTAGNHSRTVGRTSWAEHIWEEITPSLSSVFVYFCCFAERRGSKGDCVALVYLEESFAWYFCCEK